MSNENELLPNKEALAMINAVKDKRHLWWETSKRWSHKVPGLMWSGAIALGVITYCGWMAVRTTTHESQTHVVAGISAAPQSSVPANVKVRVNASKPAVGDPALLASADPVYVAERQMQARAMLQENEIRLKHELQADEIARLKEMARVQHDIVTQQIADGYKLKYMQRWSPPPKNCVKPDATVTSSTGEK